MTWALFQKIIHVVHRHCFVVAIKVSDDLEKRFHAQDVMEPLDVVYPQYWLKSTCEETFLVFMVVLKGFTINLGSLDQPKFKP
jgi:hypothetical protein